MIDKILYTFFGWLDKFCEYTFDKFISDAPKKKKKNKCQDL